MVFHLLPQTEGNGKKEEARCVVGQRIRSREVQRPSPKIFLSRKIFSSLVVVSSACCFRGLLRWAALFLGELRDGLTMINMQNAFLIVSKQYTEKQAGVLFFGE